MKSDIKYSKAYFDLYKEVEASYNGGFSAIGKIFQGFLVSKKQTSLRKKADKYLIEQKKPTHHIVATYYYYLAAREGDALSKKRLDDILNTPEVSEYFRDRGFVVSDRLEKTQSMIFMFYGYLAGDEYSEFLDYISNYYGKKYPKLNIYPVIYESNASMLLHIIYYYDETDYWAQMTRDSTLNKHRTPYEVAFECYKNWVDGADSKLFYKACMDEKIKEEHLEHLRRLEEIRQSPRKTTTPPHNMRMELDFATVNFKDAVSAVLEMIEVMKSEE